MTERTKTTGATLFNTYEGRVDLRMEDGGMALVSEPIEGGDPRTFVRIQSWSEDTKPSSFTPAPRYLHPEILALKGKRVRITIEVLPARKFRPRSKR